MDVNKMKTLNCLAVALSDMEHGKVQVNIAQIKEVIKCLSLIILMNPLAIGWMLVSGKKTWDSLNK